MSKFRVRWSLRALMAAVAVSALVFWTAKIAWDRRPVNRQIKVLRDGAAPARLRAAMELGAMDRQAASAEPALTAALHDPELSVRRAASDALVRIGSTSPALVKALVAELETPPSRRNELSGYWDHHDPASVLVRIDPPPSNLVPLLIQALQNPDVVVRGRVLDVLCPIAGRPETATPALIDALLGALKNERPFDRRRVSRAMTGMDPSVRGRAVAVLIGALERPESTDALENVFILEDLAPENRVAVPVLLARIRDGDDETRLLAVLLLGRLALADDSVVSVLVRVMTEERDPLHVVRLNPHLFWNVRHGSLSREASVWINESMAALNNSPSSLCVLALARMGENAERRAVAELIAMLRDKDDGRRRRAAAALGALGPKAVAAVPVLVELVKAGWEQARVEATHESSGPSEWSLSTEIANAVGKIGAEGDPLALAGLIEMIKHPEAPTRSYAVMALERLGPKAKKAVPALIESLKGPDIVLRRWSAAALARAGEPEVRAALPALLEAMNDDDWWVRARAAEALSFFGASARPAVPEMVRLLHGLNREIRRMTATALGELRTNASAAAPALLAAVDDEEKMVRDAALLSVPRLMPDLEPTASAASDLTSGDPPHRFRAAFALSGVLATTPTESGAVSALRSALKDDDDAVRAMAAASLGHLGPAASPATHDLIATLDDVATAVSQAAAYALGRVAPRDAAALAALAGALGDEKDEVRRSVSTTLARLGPQAVTAVPALIAAQAGQDNLTRMYMLYALGRIGPADQVVPALIAALGDRSSGIREEAVHALGRLGLRNESVVSALLSALRHDEPDVRNAAGRELGRFREPSRVLPGLLEALEERNSRTREAATVGLAGLGATAAEEALPALTAALKDEDPRVRGGAALALRNYGAAARPAESALRAALHDESRWVRSYAAQALRKLAVQEKR